MKRSYIIFFLTFIIISSTAFAPAGQALKISNGKVSFVSNAPLEVIKAASDQLKGVIDVPSKKFAFTIKINSFKGFNNPLQKEHFNENYMESQKYPEATFSGKIIEDVDFTKDGSYEIRAKGTFTVHNVPQERIIKSTLQLKQGTASIKSAFTVLLADHNIPIPKVVHEKLATQIKVEVQAQMNITK